MGRCLEQLKDHASALLPRVPAFRDTEPARCTSAFRHRVTREIAVLRDAGYRITTAAGGLIRITAPGKRALVSLRVAGSSMWLVEPDALDLSLAPDELGEEVGRRVGPAVLPWGRVVFLLPTRRSGDGQSSWIRTA
jgi:hypothetical protein